MRFSESRKLVTPVCMFFSWSLSRFKENAETSEPILLKLGTNTKKIDQNVGLRPLFPRTVLVDVYQKPIIPLQRPNLKIWALECTSNEHFDIRTMQIGSEVVALDSV